MRDRFAELLAKGKAGQLSPGEMEELASLLDAPILHSVKHPPLGFVSKHIFPQTDVAARVKAMDWFAGCGKLDGFNVTMEVERVKSWAQAMKALRARSWEKATLEARNQLTLALHHHRKRYQHWNKITAQWKEAIIDPLTEQVWEPFRQAHGLDIKLVHSIQWNILAALMENAYLDCRHGSYFFLELLTIYEAGHLPCGWSGSWPQGKLAVY